MARPKKQTVDYFPHIANSGKTIFILEQAYGNDGYAFWFKLLEILANTEKHVIDCRNPSEWKFLLAKTRVDDDIASRILDLLAELQAVDTKLWEKRIIWCQKFVNNIEDVYKNRKQDIPQKPDISSFYECKPLSDVVSTTDNPPEQEFSAQSTLKSTQSKGDKSKGDKSIVEEISIVEETIDRIPYKDIIDYFNFKANKKYEHTTDNHRKWIKARWNDGLKANKTVEQMLGDFKYVIDVKTQEWLKDKNMKKFLRPETLFGSKFEGYLNQEVGEKTLKDIKPTENFWDM